VSEADQDAGRVKRATRKTEDKPEAPPEPDRGPLSPAQHEDDGWGDTPVQMRG
jgi:hypothetical protein